MTDEQAVRILDAIERTIKAGDQLRSGEWLWLEMPAQDVADAKSVHDRYEAIKWRIGFGEAALQAKVEFGMKLVREALER